MSIHVAKPSLRRRCYCPIIIASHKQFFYDTKIFVKEEEEQSYYEEPACASDCCCTPLTIRRLPDDPFGEHTSQLWHHFLTSIYLTRYYKDIQLPKYKQSFQDQISNFGDISITITFNLWLPKLGLFWFLINFNERIISVWPILKGWNFEFSPKFKGSVFQNWLNWQN